MHTTSSWMLKTWHRILVLALVLAVTLGHSAQAGEPIITAGSAPRKLAPLRATKADAVRFEIGGGSSKPPPSSGTPPRRDSPAGAGKEPRKQASAPVTGVALRRGYGSLYEKVKSDLNGQGPVVMTAEDFAKVGPVLDKLAGESPSAAVPSARAVKVELAGDHVVLRFTSDGRTEIVPSAIPPANMSDPALRHTLEEALRELPEMLQVAPERIEQFQWNGQNYEVVIGGVRVPIIPGVEESLLEGDEKERLAAR